MSAEVTNQCVPVGDCREHPENYNVHSDAQVEELRVSLRKFGQVRSVVVQDDGKGGYVVVAGEGVLKAARANGLEELRADVIPAAWSRSKVLAYLAADNQLARQASPDEAQLAKVVDAVKAEADEELARVAAGGELELMLITTQAELARELGSLFEELQSSDESPKAGSEPGEARKQIKPVLYVEDLRDFEQALRQTGNANRGEALMEICRFYLQGGQSGKKGRKKD